MRGRRSKRPVINVQWTDNDWFSDDDAKRYYAGSVQGILEGLAFCESPWRRVEG
jgi:hypothetical protein